MVDESRDLTIEDLSPKRPVPFHAMPTEDALRALGASASQGLAEARVADLRARYGWNELAEVPAEPAWKRLLAQFNELVVWILIAAALVSGALGEWADGLAIVAIVLLNGILGFIQEDRAEKALAALQKLAAPLARVLRDGLLRSLPARDLVPGDLVRVEAGDHVPADARIVESYDLRVQEAALTGESAPVDKTAAAVLPGEAPIGDRANMLHAGTVVSTGKGDAIVAATGMATELGAIVGLVQRYKPDPTPLQRRLAELGKVLVAVCGVIVALIFVLQVARGTPVVEAFLLSVCLAVAAVPEGLPAIVTVSLALGLQRMVKRNALIRKLPSVETLGAVTVICSDKTGTLTRNEMTVRSVYAGGVWFTVDGEGFRPVGAFRKAGQAIDLAKETDLLKALDVGAWCNNARVAPSAADPNQWEVIGDPTEGALIVAAMKAGLGPHGGVKLSEVPFSSERRAMSVVVGGPGRTPVMHMKGATEVILSRCTSELRGGAQAPLSAERRAEIQRAADEMASRAMRVLGLAYREPASGAEEDLVFAGLVAMIDPPREEAKEAVRRCREAGIRPVMITGDHPATALAIARELGIAEREDEVLTGVELSSLAEDALLARVEAVSVYARVSAEHKLRVVSAWKRRGQVVAMTGDGLNDAPALRAADIGIAMGKAGTDAAKEASAMVLTDDNFRSIVDAVEEGRGIFDNIQKAVFFLLSCNAGEIFVMLLAALCGWPAPLVPIQLLWINLVTDGLPALALGMEPAEPDLMRRRPRPPREPVITLRRGFSMLFVGLLIGGATAIGFYAFLGGDSANLPQARTAAFSIMVYSQIFYAFACRSYRYTMPELGWFTNPYLLAAIGLSALLQLAVVALPFARPVFETHPHSATQAALVLALSLVPVTVLEVGKIVWKRAGRA